MTESRYRWFVAMGLLARGRRRPRGGRRPPGPGRAAATVRASSPTCDPSPPSRRGSGSRRAGCRRPPTGPVSARMSATDDAQLSAVSSTTSPSCVCSSRSTGRSQDTGALRPGGGPVGPAARRPPRRPDGPEASSRSACCRLWSHDAQGHRPAGPGVFGPSLAQAPNPRLRPALPGRGRAHGGAAARRRAPGHRWRPPASPAPPRRDRPMPEPPTPGRRQLRRRRLP